MTGLSFMGKDWDKLWATGAGTSKPGIGDRPIEWPAHGAATPFGGANPTCNTCGGRLRGKKKCSCEDPDWYVDGEPVSDGQNHGVSMALQQTRAMQEWHRQWLAGVHRVLKPGGVIKVFGATRTFHRMAAAMEQVGFVDLDLEAWMYGSGFPKSLNIQKKLAERGSPEADRFGGWGTALKPAWEPFVVGRKAA